MPGPEPCSVLRRRARGQVNRFGSCGCRRRRGHAGRKVSRRNLGDRGGGSDWRTVARGTDHGAIDWCATTGAPTTGPLTTAPATGLPGISRSIAPSRTISEDRAPLVGFEDRVNARLQPGRDQRLDARDRQFLVLRVGQVDDLGHEVAAVDDLVEILGRELDGDRRCESGRRRWRGSRGDLDRRVEADAWRPGMFVSLRR